MKRLSDYQIEVEDLELRRYFWNKGIDPQNAKSPFRFPSIVEKYLEEEHSLSVSIYDYKWEGTKVVFNLESPLPDGGEGE